MASESHINEYDRNLNGISAKDLINKFATNVQQDIDNDRQEVSSQEYQNNDNYTIVPINSFEEASQYGKYTSWCVTHQSTMFNSYTNDGYGQFYFCLRKGFENVPQEKGENCPLDEYGLSMIAVSVDEKGSLSTCTCRWNHDNGGNDNIMNTKQISQMIGHNFYEVFKPNDKARKAIEEMEAFLKDATDIDRQAWSCDRLDGIEDIAFVTPNRSSRAFIVNTKTRTILGDGQLFKKMKQIVDINYRRWPLIEVQAMDENYNILDPMTNKMLFDNNLWFIESFFRCGNALYALIEAEQDSYMLYNLSDKKFVMEIPGVLDNKEGDKPFCDIEGILYSFYDDNSGESYFLFNDGRLLDEEETLELCNVSYDDDDYGDYDDYEDDY